MNTPEGRPAYGRISLRRNASYRRFWRIELNGAPFNPAGWSGWQLHMHARKAGVADPVISLSQAAAPGGTGIWPSTDPANPGFDVVIPRTTIAAVSTAIGVSADGRSYLYFDLRGTGPDGLQDVPLEGEADLVTGVTGTAP